MKASYFFSPHLGEYIMQLQHVVPVDGRLLSEESLARRARMSKTTVERIKRGRKASVCLLRHPSYLLGSLSGQSGSSSGPFPP